MLKMSELDYELPPEAIAVKPAEPRDHSRLMVVPRGDAGAACGHRRFYELPELMRRGDLLVTNNTRVVPAQLTLRKKTGAVIPGLFVAQVEGSTAI